MPDNFETILQFYVFLPAVLLGAGLTLRDVFRKMRQRSRLQQQIELAPALPATFDEFDDEFGIEGNWEVRAVQWLNENRELSAIELIQQQTGMGFEEAQVKLLKLSEELDS